MHDFIGRMQSKQIALIELYKKQLAEKNQVKSVLEIIGRLINDAAGTLALDFLNLKLNEVQRELSQITADAFVTHGRLQQVDEFIRERMGDDDMNNALSKLSEAIAESVSKTPETELAAQ